MAASDPPFTRVARAGWVLAALVSAGALAVPGEVVGDSLPAPVRAALAKEKLPAESLSVVVHQVDAREPLLSINAGQARNPASTMKLVTTLAGLHVLGPSFTWHTDAYVATNQWPGVRGAPGVEGRLGGNLYLKGGGDPFLVTEQLWRLLRGLRRLGVRDIGGDIVIDDSYFQLAAPRPGVFDGKPQRAYNVGPDAALLNFRANTIRIEAGQGRKTPQVTIDPPLHGLQIANQLTFSETGCRGRLNVRLEVVDPDIPSVRLSGSFPRSCGKFEMLRVLAAREAYARGLLSRLWAELGGRLGGAIRFGLVPEEVTRILRHESQPLSQLIWSMNKFSNNVMTRQLLLTLGAEADGPPGTLAKGRAVVRAWLGKLDLPLDKFRLDNGAGLSRSARISAGMLAGLLMRAYHSPLMAEFVSTLPLAAVDGSLRKRFTGERLAGRAHLKTGLLNDVRSIAGYVHVPGAGDHIVVMLQNYPNVHQGRGTKVQDALLGWLLARSGSPASD